MELLGSVGHHKSGEVCPLSVFSVIMDINTILSVPQACNLDIVFDSDNSLGPWISVM